MTLRRWDEKRAIDIARRAEELLGVETRVNMAVATAMSAESTAGAAEDTAASAESLASTALQPADIGVTVQAYHANLDAWASLAPSAKQDAITPSAPISDASGGATIDAEARTAINSVLSALRAAGIVGT